ncbi:MULTISPECIES: acyltransferase family protein [Marinobacter]|uniref:acyltransferase family protein n=1 Tax=Marinobacter TaxID=2742 RepID=UPI0013A6D686|nr:MULTISPECIES: acyltransferase [Marinobacter]
MAEITNTLSGGLADGSSGVISGAKAGRRTDLNVETLRGLACLLLVGFHVVGGKPYTGLRVEDPDSIYRLVTDALAYLRMPLFTFLSGYVYAMRPFSGGAGRFMQGKVRRLLVPMLVVGTLFAILKSVAPGTNTPMALEDFLTLHIVPVEHFWYVESLFWIFLLVMLLEMGGLLSTGRRFIAVMAIGCVIHVLYQKPPIYLGFAGAIYLIPFFLFGAACNRFRETLFRPTVLWPAGLLFVLCGTWALMGVAGLTARVPDQSVPALVIGCCSGLFLLASQWKVRWLVFIGGFSYSIYIYHVFAAAPSRIILEKLGVTDTFLLLVVGLVCGIVAPIIVDRVASRYGWSRLVLLGKRR